MGAICSKNKIKSSPEPEARNNRKNNGPDVTISQPQIPVEKQIEPDIIPTNILEKKKTKEIKKKKTVEIQVENVNPIIKQEYNVDTRSPGLTLYQSPHLSPMAKMSRGGKKRAAAQIVAGESTLLKNTIKVQSSLFNEENIASFMNANGIETVLKELEVHSNLEKIKAAICCLCCFFTFNEGEYAKNADKFRTTASKFIDHLFDEGNKTITDSEFTKFWTHFLTITNRACVEPNRWENGFSKLEFLWEKMKSFLLERIDKLAKFYKILIFQKFLELEMLRKYNDEEEHFKNAWTQVKEFNLNKIHEGRDELQRQRSLRHGKKEIFTFMERHLNKILSFQPDDDVFKQAMLIGRFDKNIFDLEHTIILGEDGGWYILINSLTEDEKTMIIDEVDASTTFKEYMKTKLKIHKTKKGKIKLVIGTGSFGKIRLAVTLIITEKSKEGESCLMCGEVVCMKKSADLKNQIPNTFSMRMAVWNDYSSEIVGKNIHSPEIYDMGIICSTLVNEKHNKGYTIQEFAHFTDGGAFKKEESGLQVWSHQRTYLIDIFGAVFNLMEEGIAMTDLKPQNTLYDKVNKVGKLIDLAGVLRKKNFQDLQKCKARNITELTEMFTAPEIMKKIRDNDLDSEVDLTKALAYTMGKIIQDLVIEVLNKNQNKMVSSLPDLSTLKKNSDKVDGTVEEDVCPNPPLLLELVKGLTEEEVDKRLSFQAGLKKLVEIGPDSEEEKVDFTEFIDSIREMIKENPKSLGLKSDINKILNAFINVKVTSNDPESSGNTELRTHDLTKTLKEFLDKKRQLKEPSFLLLGSAGTGKSTILQIQFINLIENWKPKDPIPFFMNLATNLFIQERWYMINEFIKKKNPNFKPIPFSVFTGASKIPLILLLDSFDESKQKTNLVKKFMKDLGNNQQNKAVICCRTDYLSEGKKDMWFRVSKDSELVVKYIAPLDASFDIMNHIENFIKVYDCKLSVQEYKSRIETSNLKEMMKTNYMVYLTLTVLPEFQTGTLITKYDIYKKYTQKIITNETSKYLKPDIENIKSFFEVPQDTEIDRFFEKVAQNLASVLHVNDIKRLDSFLNTYKFKSENNMFQERIVPCLNLKLENEKKDPPTITFSHDMIKNFYLAEAIFEESDNGKTHVLGEKSIANDETLVKFLAGAIKSDLKRIDSFKSFIYQTKSLANDLKDENIESSFIIAASNAITILVAANVPFVEENLTNIKIRNASLRDGIFSGSDFTDADLTNVNMVNCKLNDTLFMRTNLKGVNFGIEPDLRLQEEITSMDLMSNDSCLLTTDKTEGFTLYDLRDGNKPLKVQKGLSETSVAIFSPDRFFIGSGGKDGQIRISDSSTGKELRLLHDRSVITSLVFSTDCSFIANGSEDGSIKVWDLQRKKLKKEPIISFKGHADAVTCLTITNNNEGIISGSRDKTLKSWELKEGKATMLKKFEGHTDVVTSVAFFSERETFVSGSKDTKIIAWNLIAGKAGIFEDGHTLAVNCVKISPNGKFVLSCSVDKTIKLWDKATRKLIKTLEGHSDSVICAHFSQNGKSIVSLSKDRLVKFWKLNPGAMVKTFNGQNHIIHGLSISKDGSLICSGSADKTIKVFDRNYGNLLKTLNGHKDEVKSVSFSPDKKLIASASFDNMVIIWDVENGICKNFIQHKSFVNSVTFSRDGKIIASGSLDKTIKLWDIENEKLLKTLNEPEEKQISLVCFSPNGVFLASCSENQRCFKIWNVQSGQVENKVVCHSNDILSMAYSSDNETFATGSADETIILWDVAKSYGKIAPLSCNTAVNCLMFSNDCKLLLSGGSDHTIKIWDAQTKKMLKFLEGHNGGITGVAITDDNQTIISSSIDKTVRIWEKSKGKSFKKSLGLDPGGGTFISMEGKEIKFLDSKEGNLLITLKGHTEAIICYCFSKKILKQGNYIITGSADCQIKQWNSGNGKLSKTYVGHKGKINDILYSLDENFILSASDDSTIKMWDNVHENCLATKQEHKGAVLCLALSKDGKKLLSGGEDRIVRLWKLESSSLVLEKEYKGAENMNFLIKFVEFSDNEALVFGCDEDHVVIWDINSGNIDKKLGGVEGWREFKKSCNQDGFNFYNRLIISPDETSLYCTHMFMKNSKNLSKKNRDVLTQRQAIILKEEN